MPVLILKIRICTPIKGLWNPTVDASCFNQQSIFFTDAIVSVVTDVVVLLLPGPLLVDPTYFLLSLICLPAYMHTPSGAYKEKMGIEHSRRRNPSLRKHISLMLYGVNRVSTLKVSTCKKVRIAALLGAGGLATIASVWRAILVWSPNAYEDITVSFVRINLLGYGLSRLLPSSSFHYFFFIIFYFCFCFCFGSLTHLRTAEVGIGIICACLPTCNILVTRYTKELWGANSKCTATGEQSPPLKMRRLTGDGKGIHVWRKGHRYNKSLESDGDEVLVESGGGDGGGRGCRGEVENMGIDRDVEREAVMESVVESKTEVEIEADRQKKRQRSIEEDPGWPLSGGASVLPCSERGEMGVMSSLARQQNTTALVGGECYEI